MISYGLANLKTMSEAIIGSEPYLALPSELVCQFWYLSDRSLNEFRSGSASQILASEMVCCITLSAREHSRLE